MKTFHIKHQDHQILLETEDTRFESLRQLALCIGNYLLEKGRIEDAKSISVIIDFWINNPPMKILM